MLEMLEERTRRGEPCSSSMGSVRCVQASHAGFQAMQTVQWASRRDQVCGKAAACSVLPGGAVRRAAAQHAELTAALCRGNAQFMATSRDAELTGFLRTAIGKAIALVLNRRPAEVRRSGRHAGSGGTGNWRALP